MKWKNLQNALCPKCDQPLQLEPKVVAEKYECTNFLKCNYKITIARFAEIQEDLDLGRNSFTRKQQFTDESGWNKKF